MRHVMHASAAVRVRQVKMCAGRWAVLAWRHTPSLMGHLPTILINLFAETEGCPKVEANHSWCEGAVAVWLGLDAYRAAQVFRQSRSRENEVWTLGAAIS